MSEMENLDAVGVDYKNRLFLSDRAHIVFDFHQQLDGLNESKLGGNKIGTTHKGIGPAYGSKVMRNGLRIGDLADFPYFEQRLRLLVSQLKLAHPDLKVDIEQEIAYYRKISEKLVPMITDTIYVSNNALAAGQNILVEGANATSEFILLSLTSSHVTCLMSSACRSARYRLRNVSVRHVI